MRLLRIRAIALEHFLIRAYAARVDRCWQIGTMPPHEDPKSVTIRTEHTPGSTGATDVSVAIPSAVRSADNAGSALTVATVQTWKAELSLAVRGRLDQQAVSNLLAEEVATMDAAASRFRDDSQISSVNREAGHWVDVSDYLADVLEASLQAAELTAGLVNPGMGKLVDAAGYRAWRDGRSAPQSRPSGLGNPDAWRAVELLRSGATAQVRIPQGVQLDVGAVAKGWLADRVALLAADRFGCDVLANMGGDLRVVTGEQPWTVLVDPLVEGVAPQSIEVWDAGIATSGTGKRQWTQPDGTTAHHIIDPRSGRPAASPWASCSVMAASAAQANAVSTAGVILGEQGPDWVAAQGLDALFVGASGQLRTVGRWP